MYFVSLCAGFLSAVFHLHMLAFYLGLCCLLFFSFPLLELSFGSALNTHSFCCLSSFSLSPLILFVSFLSVVTPCIVDELRQLPVEKTAGAVAAMKRFRRSAEKKRLRKRIFIRIFFTAVWPGACWWRQPSKPLSGMIRAHVSRFCQKKKPFSSSAYMSSFKASAGILHSTWPTNVLNGVGTSCRWDLLVHPGSQP